MPGTYNKLVTVVTGQTITAAERNNEHDNHINNATPDGVDDASGSLAAMQATADPYPAGAASQPTDLRGELQRIRYQLQLLASDTYWYQDPTFLASLNGSATLGATAASLKVRLDQLATQIKSLGGLTNWYDAVTAALLKAGGTMSGAIAMGNNKITGLAAGTTAGDAVRYEQAALLAVASVFTAALTANASFRVDSGGATAISSNMDVSGKTHLYHTGGALTIQGFQGGSQGQVLFIENRDAAANLSLAHNGSGTQVFLLNGGSCVIGPRGGVTCIYSSGGSAWFVVGKFG